MKIHVSVEGSSQECADVLKRVFGSSLPAGKLPETLEHMGLDFQTQAAAEAGNPTESGENPFESVSWSAIHLYHVIRANHTGKRADYFYMAEKELESYRLSHTGAAFEPEQLSRITGGARQTTNKLSLPPILEISRSGVEKRFHANRWALAGFDRFIQDWGGDYRNELKERGCYFPGEEPAA